MSAAQAWRRYEEHMREGRRARVTGNTADKNEISIFFRWGRPGEREAGRPSANVAGAMSTEARRLIIRQTTEVRRFV